MVQAANYIKPFFPREGGSGGQRTERFVGILLRSAIPDFDISPARRAGRELSLPFGRGAEAPRPDVETGRGLQVERAHDTLVLLVAVDGVKGLPKRRAHQIAEVAPAFHQAKR